MHCPVCKQSMIVLEVEEIEVDHCLSCGGVWLDGGELELLLEGAKEKDALLSSLAIDTAASEKKLKCPICSKKMAVAPRRMGRRCSSAISIRSIRKPLPG